MRTFIIAIALGSAGLACSSNKSAQTVDTSAPAAHAAGPSAAVKSTRTGPERGAFGPSNISYSTTTPKTTSLIKVDATVARVCKLGEQEVYFALDSASISPDAEDKLSKVASCLKRSDIGNVKIEVIGYTDPTGSAEHNDDLGMSRAESVRDAICEKGVDKALIEAKSGGEIGSDNDQSGWPAARRVEIIVAEG
jgi:outer membrane protein OmpA-like peptidoglycan-associated protein